MINILISSAGCSARWTHHRCIHLNGEIIVEYRKIKRTHNRAGCGLAWKINSINNLCVPIAWLLNASSNHVSIPIVSIIFRWKLFHKHKNQQLKNDSHCSQIRRSILNWIYYTWVHWSLYKWPFNMADLTLFENQSTQSYSYSCYALYSNTKYFEYQRLKWKQSGNHKELLTTTTKEYRTDSARFWGHRQCVTTPNNFCFSYNHKFRTSTQNVNPKCAKQPSLHQVIPLK